MPETARFTWRQAHDGLLAVRFSGRVPGADWGQAGRECGVVQLWLDGAYHQDVILVHGQDGGKYERMLGEVAAGPHLLEVRVHPEAPPRPQAIVTALGVEELRPSDALEEMAWRQAPVLYLRAERDPWESLWTDTPLLLFYRPLGSALEFQCMFSHEDAGTDTPGLLAEWGRTTDIEWILRLDPEGDAATIQGRGHHVERHSGRRVLGRYSLQVVGLHGMVSSEAPRGTMRCLFVPRWRWDPRWPREACMDAAPWAYRLTALEVLRQGRIKSDSAAEELVAGDLRSYLYLHLGRRDDPDTGAIGIQVLAHLHDGRVYSSTHGIPNLAVRRNGPFATTIKLPSGARLARLRARPTRPVEAGGVCLRLIKAFFLDAGYRPAPPCAEGDTVWLCPGIPEVTLWTDR